MTTRGVFDHLPIIDIAGMYSDDLSMRQKTAQPLGNAARQSGFFYIKGHRVTSDLSSALMLASTGFFCFAARGKNALLRWYR